MEFIYIGMKKIEKFDESVCRNHGKVSTYLVANGPHIEKKCCIGCYIKFVSPNDKDVISYMGRKLKMEQEERKNSL